MVDDHRPGTDRQNHYRNRAQIILIGAITIAFIILGVVVVFNGVLYTETLSSTGTSQSGADANSVETEVENGVRGIGQYGNINWENISESEYEDHLETSINNGGGYGELYENATATYRPTITAVRAPATTQTVVTPARIETDVDIDDGDMNLSETEERVGHLELRLENASAGDTVEIDADGSTLTLERTSDSFEVVGEDCEIYETEIAVELVGGSVNASTDGDDCDALSHLDYETEYEEITIDDGGDDIEGEYDIVVRGSDSLDIDGIVDQNQYGAWTIEVEISHDSNDISYAKTHEFDVYGDRS